MKKIDNRSDDNYSAMPLMLGEEYNFTAGLASGTIFSVIDIKGKVLNSYSVTDGSPPCVLFVSALGEVTFQSGLEKNLEDVYLGGLSSDESSSDDDTYYSGID